MPPRRTGVPSWLAFRWERANVGPCHLLYGRSQRPPPSKLPLLAEAEFCSIVGLPFAVGELILLPWRSGCRDFPLSWNGSVHRIFGALAELPRQFLHQDPGCA